MVKPVSVQYRKCRQVVGAPDTIRTCDLCLRRATLYPAELRVRCGSFSRLAVRRQRPCKGWLGVRARPRKAKVTRSNRVGCARKHVPNVPGSWRARFHPWMLREMIQSLARCPGVQMNSLHDRPQRSLMLNPNTRRTACRSNVGHHGDVILVPKLADRQLIFGGLRRSIRRRAV